MAKINANVELGDLLVVGGLTFSGLWLWDHNKNDGNFFSEIKSSFKKFFSKDDTKSDDDKKTKLDETKYPATGKAQIVNGKIPTGDGMKKKTNYKKGSAENSNEDSNSKLDETKAAGVPSDEVEKKGESNQYEGGTMPTQPPTNQKMDKVKPANSTPVPDTAADTDNDPSAADVVYVSNTPAETVPENQTASKVDDECSSTAPVDEKSADKNPVQQTIDGGSDNSGQKKKNSEGKEK